MSVSYLPQIIALEKKISNTEGDIIRVYEGGLEKLRELNDKLNKKEGLLFKARQAYFDLFKYSTIGICEVGLDGKFLKVNDAWCKMCRRSEEELLQLTWMDITREKYIKQDENAVFRLITKQDRTYTMYKEYFYINEEGREITIPIILTVSCVFDGDNVEKFISQGIDIENIKVLVDELKGKNYAR